MNISPFTADDTDAEKRRRKHRIARQNTKLNKKSDSNKVAKEEQIKADLKEDVIATGTINQDLIDEKIEKDLKKASSFMPLMMVEVGECLFNGGSKKDH